MATYKIPCVWQQWGIMYIDAERLADALQLAYEQEPLPGHGDYLEDSFEVDQEGVKIHNELSPDDEDDLCEFMQTRALHGA